MATPEHRPGSYAEALLQGFIREGRHIWRGGLATPNALNRAFTAYTGWTDRPGLGMRLLREVDPEMAAACRAVCPSGVEVNRAAHARSVQLVRRKRSAL